MEISLTVTAIIIFFDAKEFLSEAVESVIKQTFQDWELILVDDGSKDGSTELAIEYAEKYPNQIRYTSHPEHKNLGMSASRNLGIEKAKGEFIAFLDADDIWLPHKLKEQVKTLKEVPNASMCFGPTKVWHDWNGSTDTTSHDWYTSHGTKTDILVDPPELLINLLKDEWTVPCICSVLIRRSAIEIIGSFNEKFRGQMEDMVFHTKMFFHRQVYVSSECYALYRQHQNNSGKKAMASGEWLPHLPNPARCAYLIWVESYLETTRNCPLEVSKALEIELEPYRGYIY